MQLAKAGLTLLVGVLILVSASSAPAELPDTHVLSGDTYPATGEGTVEGAEVYVLETELGEKITGTSVTYAFELTELSSLGPGFTIVRGAKEKRTNNSCSTSGDPAGTIKIPVEIHGTKRVPLGLGFYLAILHKEVVIVCSTIKVKVRAPVLYKVEKVTSGTDITEFGLVAKCAGKGQQEQKEYANDEGKEVKAVLTANFGLGFETACENISKELVVKSNKMIDDLF